MLDCMSGPLFTWRWINYKIMWTNSTDCHIPYLSYVCPATWDKVVSHSIGCRLIEYRYTHQTYCSCRDVLCDTCDFSTLGMKSNIHKCTLSLYLGWGWPQLYKIIVWPEILRGIYFGRLAVLEQSANIIRQNMYFIVWCHHYCKIISFDVYRSVVSHSQTLFLYCATEEWVWLCGTTRPAARRAGLIVGMVFTIKSCVRGHHFSKSFVHRGARRVGLSISTKKESQTTCMRSL